MRRWTVDGADVTINWSWRRVVYLFLAAAGGLCIGVSAANAQAKRPATSPTSAPAITDTRPLYEITVKAGKVATKARAAAEQRWEESNECKMLKSDLEKTQDERDRAKAGTDLQEKLATSKAYNDARLAIEAAMAKSLDADGELKAAQVAHRLSLDDLERAEKRNAKLRAEADAKDPIKVAMKNHKVAIGMTLAQVEESVKRKGVLVRETETQKLYDFSPFIPASGARTGYLVWFVDGKAADIIPP